MQRPTPPQPPARLRPRGRWGLVLALLAGGCGGGGGASDDTPARVLPAELGFSGYATSAGGYQLNFAPLVGDGAGLISRRALVRFDLSEVPSRAQVLEATLRVFQVGTTGAPYTDFGDMVVDHVRMGAALDGTDFDGGTLSPAFAVAFTGPAQGYRSLNVTAQVAADLAAGRTTSDYRFLFPDAPGPDELEDAAILGLGGDGSLTTLTVKFRLP